MIFIRVLLSCVHVLCRMSSARACSRELVGQCLRRAGSPASRSARRHPDHDHGDDCLCPVKRPGSALLCGREAVNENLHLSLFPACCANKAIHATFFPVEILPILHPACFWLYSNSSRRTADLFLSVLAHPYRLS